MYKRQIIDSDYFYSDNEGHIFSKITNDSNENKTLTIPADTGSVSYTHLDVYKRQHQKLVEKIIEQKQEGAQAVVLALGTASRTILTKEERCRILKEMGEMCIRDRSGTAPEYKKE